MTEQTRVWFLESVLDRTIGNLRAAWRDIAASARGAVGAPPRPDLPPEDAARLRDQMAACLDGRGGEVSARARAAALGRTYLGLTAEGRERFLRLLADSFDLDHGAARSAAAVLAAAEAPEAAREAERALRRVLEPPRVKLLTQFNALPEGVKFLVDLRAELLPLTRDDPVLAELDRDLRALLANWFDIGFLELRRITWEAPAALLEKLIAYEAVHEIRDWNDLKNRLEPDRRCFAFFHPRMPDEPLIFVEVALVKGIATRIDPLLDVTAPLGDPAEADTAIFYSISNCQRGLDGISFGNFLIKRVVDFVSAELGGIRTFATLSPIPGFRRWLDRELAEGPEAARLRPAEAKALAAAAGEEAGLAEVLAGGRWHTDPVLGEAVREPLLRHAARYLTTVRRDTGRAIDPVAHFHFSNGARVEQIDWLADVSAKGLRQSHGLMVNYLYRQDSIEANHEAYTGEGKVAASATLRGLARERG